jgi:hypothetical protein
MLLVHEVKFKIIMPMYKYIIYSQENGPGHEQAAYPGSRENSFPVKES